MNSLALSPLLLIGSIISFSSLSCTKTTSELPSDEFTQNIRTTEARSPMEEQAGFRLPPGFEIQLYASEPDIGKPLNMAFDAKGRMWLTQSYAYPFADTTGTAKDKISILEDTDGDGSADKIITFAEGLNIPIGILPVQDGAIAYSIPSIDHYFDRDGDGKVDERKVLYKGFEYKDTHGMINNLVRSWDGWIHADHGFANHSVVAGSDGDTIVLNSGNTFRFRADGSHLEFTTTGRVNPYGYAYDEMGYTYSSDCHTSPIYQLVRGADYPHFSKKSTGIGFGPALMDHNYGSTALAGLEYYLGTQFPEAFRNSFYIGDVVKSRVYRATMRMKGTTPQITWEDEFILSEDPWFRPVDVKLGPDGALYIADFYNRIIGHYEVPLDHPGRDRQRGRIWRIVYSGSGTKGKFPDWTQVGMEELLTGLDHANLPLRMRVADEIVDRIGKEATGPVSSLLAGAETSDRQYVQGLWILYRLNELSTAQLSEALQSDALLRKVHGLRILFEMGATAHKSLVKLAEQALNDESPHVQRQATMVLAQHPSRQHLQALLRVQQRVSEEDSHFFYAIRQAIRDQLREEELLNWVVEQQWKEAHSRSLAELMRGVESPLAAHFLTEHMEGLEESIGLTGEFARHAGRYASPAILDRLVSVLKSRTENETKDHYQLFERLEEGLAERGLEMPAKGRAWGVDLARAFLQESERTTSGWRVIPHKHHPYQRSPWQLVEDISADAQLPVIASGPVDGSGYSASSMQSPVFRLPASLRFFLAGYQHELSPNETPTAPANWVELRLAGTDSLITKTLATEAKLNQFMNWSVAEHEGAEAYIQIVDGSRSGGEYIAIGGFDPPVVQLPQWSPDQQADRLRFACRIVGTYQEETLLPIMEALLKDPNADVHARVAAAASLFEHDENQASFHTFFVLDKMAPSPLLQEGLSILLSKNGILSSVLGDLSYQAQKEIAENLANNSEGMAQLLKAAEQGSLSPRILLEPQLQKLWESSITPEQQVQMAALTANVPALEEDIPIPDQCPHARLPDATTLRRRRQSGLYPTLCKLPSNQCRRRKDWTSAGWHRQLGATGIDRKNSRSQSEHFQSLQKLHHQLEKRPKSNRPLPAGRGRAIDIFGCSWTGVFLSGG